MKISNGKVIRPQKVVIYGSEGIGKSTLAAQFPNPLFIDTEGGTAQLDVRRIISSSAPTLPETSRQTKQNQPRRLTVRWQPLWHLTGQSDAVTILVLLFMITEVFCFYDRTASCFVYLC